MKKIGKHSGDCEDQAKNIQPQRRVDSRARPTAKAKLEKQGR